MKDHDYLSIMNLQAQIIESQDKSQQNNQEIYSKKLKIKENLLSI